MSYIKLFEEFVEELNEAKFSDYDNKELEAYIKNNPNDKEAAKEYSKRAQKIKALTRTDEAVDVKYWEDYNKSSQGVPKDWEDKETDFEEAWEDAVVEWQREADQRLTLSQIKRAEKVAREFFKKAKWISMNIALAILSQES